MLRQTKKKRIKVKSLAQTNKILWLLRMNKNNLFLGQYMRKLSVYIGQQSELLTNYNCLKLIF